MIELAFGESTAGALKLAKSMKQGARIDGAVGVIGGTAKERRAIKRPRYWEGMTMEGQSSDVAALPLMLDIGDLSDLDVGMRARKAVLDALFAPFPDASGALWQTNRKTLHRLAAAKATLEPVRMWISENDPGELCGFYFVCHLMAAAQTPLCVVRIPMETERDGAITRYRSTGELHPELFGGLVGREEKISEAQRRAYAAMWRILVNENAPLRAIVNGTLMSVPETFYDFALRESMPEGECRIAHIIGNAFHQVSGVGDQWLFCRIQAMLSSGELTLVSPAAEDHPYSQIVRCSMG